METSVINRKIIKVPIDKVWNAFTHEGKLQYRITLIQKGIEILKDPGEGFSEQSFTQGWNEITGQSLKPYPENQ